jgi:hypothetical protein
MMHPAFQIPTAIALPIVKWIGNRLMPVPEVLADIEKLPWNGGGCQFLIHIRLKRGFLFWKNKLSNCRLYLIRRDFGDMSSDPEGIWLKWIIDGRSINSLSIPLEIGSLYKAAVIVRDLEGYAYITNEEFVETQGQKRKWPLPAGRDSFPKDDFGRYTFWIDVGVGQKRWRSTHYYAAHIPPADVGNGPFRLEALLEAVRAR